MDCTVYSTISTIINKTFTSSSHLLNQLLYLFNGVIYSLFLLYYFIPSLFSLSKVVVDIYVQHYNKICKYNLKFSKIFFIMNWLQCWLSIFLFYVFPMFYCISFQVWAYLEAILYENIHIVAEFPTIKMFRCYFIFEICFE